MQQLLIWAVSVADPLSGAGSRLHQREAALTAAGGAPQLSLVGYRVFDQGDRVALGVGRGAISASSDVVSSSPRASRPRSLMAVRATP